MADIQGTFVSEKVNKVRWIPEEYEESHCFITGSWDNVNNYVRLWQCEDEGEGEGPVCVSSWQTAGSVAEMELVNPTMAAVGCTQGTVSLLTLPQHSNAPLGPASLRMNHTWNDLHKFQDGTPSACTGLAVMDGDMVTVGEDGRMNFLTCHQPKVVRTIDEADSCTFHCVCFLKHNEVITGNLRGQMKIWDLRSASNTPATTFLFSNDHVAATSVVHHPTQRHLILAGSESGSIAVWDLRVNTYPASFLNAHSSSINEIRFHPDHPQRLFTCSINGEIWHWNTTSMSKHITSTTNSLNANESTINPWLISDDDKSNLEIQSLMTDMHKSINSLDCNKNRVICGCDNEAVYIISNVFE